MTKQVSIDTSEILGRAEVELRKHKLIDVKDYLILYLLSDGSGLVLCRTMKRGIMTDRIFHEYERLSDFYSWAKKIIGE